ncbi:Spermine synthase [Magnetococcus marinus MC-1]|uniref:Polyamine aminopropyltransferase n=1 Tax=Magnetococcus marinus (strain ATCC BAA-1437 / JCM 17883 / MC-1) TaxID=156889 RepID=A0LCG7_MAGMM|nr:polyamine aminopropyltransferase [Magnetococcus marinus]ABK45660.1 Spermine synthase [Magnetococcus marinus MC-1]
MQNNLEHAPHGDAARSLDLATLVYAVFTAGLCSIIYELLIATTVVYFLGDSVRYFSLTIGLYMASMGAGAYLSKYMQGVLLHKLIVAEIILGLVGGFCVPLLYLAFTYEALFLPLYVVLTLTVGFLIGLEVPLLTRILEGYDSLRVSIAHVLSLDYLGALVATVAFPLLLLPLFGIFRSGLFFGLVNMSIAVLLLWRFGSRLGSHRIKSYRLAAWSITLAIGAGLLFAQVLLQAWNQSVYRDRILHTEHTAYQEVVLTKRRDDLRLYLNGALQFSTSDEFRYHEALVHLPMAYVQAAKARGPLSVLVLGGGDGMAVRELLRYNRIERITLVDLDERVLKLATENPYLRQANAASLSRDERVKIRVGDAMRFLQERAALFDLIVADLPDPSSTETARLYSRAFYRLARSNLAPAGVFVTQATSPFHAREAFWTTHATVADVFAQARPYHLLVPSFGDWGFVMAGGAVLQTPLEQVVKDFPPGLRHLRPAMATGMFMFGKDVEDPGQLGISTLDQPQVLERYRAGWRHWGG